MSLLQSIKNFFAPHQTKQEPAVPVMPTPIAESAPVVVVTAVEVKEVQPELVVTVVEAAPISEVKVPEPVREEVKASSPEARPSPTGPKPSAKKTPAKKVPGKKVPVAAPTKKPAARTTSKKK